jgi:hypothetical protein
MRRWGLPALVIWPRWVELALEYSEGTRPQKPANAAARAEPAPPDLGYLLIGRQDPDRDRVAMDIKTEMDGGAMRDTGHGRLLPYVGSARPVWVTHVRCGPEPAVP